MAATLLALRPGHNAATPTLMRQGSLVTADALPIAVGLLCPRSWFCMTQGKLYQPLTKDQLPDATRGL